VRGVATESVVMMIPEAGGVETSSFPDVQLHI
jgi:hypothetical protein